MENTEPEDTLFQQSVLDRIHFKLDIIRKNLEEVNSNNYGGMLYRYFKNKLDLDSLSGSAINSNSPITKEEILDFDLLEENLDKYKKNWKCIGEA